MRSEEAINEFGDNDRLLSAAFPYIFMYGKAYSLPASLPKLKIRHLLLQFTNFAANDTELRCLLFNQQTRHANIRGLVAKVKGNREAFARFSEDLLSSEFETKLKKAARNPYGKYGDVVINRIKPILQISGRNTMGGSIETHKVVDHIYAMTRHFGPASIFYTIAPDDINNPTSFRLSQNFVNNKQFPSQSNSSFIDAMKNNSSVIASDNIEVPVGYTDRARAAARNPVATTLEYQNLIENILTILMKVKMKTFGTKYKKVRSTYFMQSSTVGLFGHMYSALGVTEAQSRSSLHLHLILFGGLTPKLLEKV